MTKKLLIWFTSLLLFLVPSFADASTTITTVPLANSYSTSGTPYIAGTMTYNAPAGASIVGYSIANAYSGNVTVTTSTGYSKNYYNTGDAVNVPNASWITINATGMATFFYVVLATDTADSSASTNATNAANAATGAQTSATNAYNNTNTIINSYLSTNAGVIQDSAGNTVLGVAKAASQNAINAKTSADNAYNAINTASSSLSNQLNNVQSNVQSSLNNLGSTLSNVQSSLSNVQNNVNNIQAYIPPILNKVSGYKNATATTDSNFNVSLSFSGANEYRYNLDGGAWSDWTTIPGSKYFTATGISGSGFHSVNVEIRYNSGTIQSLSASGDMTFYKQ